MELIYAQDLMVGDYFKEVDESRKANPGRVSKPSEPCLTEFNNIHINTSRGHWCIAKTQPIWLTG